MYNMRRLIVLVLFNFCVSSRIPLGVFQRNQRYPAEYHHYSHRVSHPGSSSFYKKKLHEHTTLKVLYQVGTSEEGLPDCNTRSICNKMDLYDTPWVERQCRCPNGKTCPMDLSIDDGQTFVETTRQYKVCEITKLPRCSYFRDTTWSITLYQNNVTDQVIHCHCPKNSVSYLNKRNVLHLSNGQLALQYHFSCSPETRLLCQRKEPCRMFAVSKRQEFLDEVTVNTLCQCPPAHRCPHHHTDPGIISAKSFSEDTIKTYSGYCLPP